MSNHRRPAPHLTSSKDWLSAGHAARKRRARAKVPVPAGSITQAPELPLADAISRLEAPPVYSVQLPWPPTLNHNTLPNGRGGRILTAEHKTFRREVWYACNQARVPAFGNARLMVQILAFPPDRRARDLDNLVKPVLDALQKAGVYVNDAQVDEISISRRERREQACVIVGVSSLEAAA